LAACIWHEQFIITPLNNWSNNKLGVFMGGIIPKHGIINMAVKHILLVDDEAVFRRLYSDILTMKGFEVTECEDGSEALEAFLESPKKYDLVMTDYVMPALNGLQLAQKIREINHNIPIVLCTGYTSALDDKVVKNTAINAVLSKPLTLAEFENCVDRFLD
jgi:CheY-like chemotaxis protein